MPSREVNPGSDGAISSETLERIKCPVCGNPMSHGYIAGHWFRLRWTEKEKTRTIFAGTKLRRKIDWLSAPTLEAVRCENCMVGVFRYGY